MFTTETAESAVERFRTVRVLPNLDILRGVAILGVLIHHVDAFPWPVLHTLQENGRYGVSMFFAISGYLICTLLLREEQKKGQVNLKNFYIRRALRLFPLYYAVLLLYCVLVFPLGQFSPENQALFRHKLPYHVFYLSNFFAATGPFFFAWSLAVEEQFYLTFSVLFRLLQRSFLIALIAVLPLLKWVLLDLFNLDSSPLYWQILLSYSEPMLMGVFAAFAMNNDRIVAMLHQAIQRGLLWVSGVGILGLLFLVELHDKSGSWNQLLYLLMTLFLVGSSIVPECRMPGHAVMAYIGKVSYSVYLLHMLVIMAVSKLFTDNPVATLLITIPIIAMVSGLVYRYFENPILQYKKRFSAI